MGARRRGRRAPTARGRTPPARLGACSSDHAKMISGRRPRPHRFDPTTTRVSSCVCLEPAGDDTLDARGGGGGGGAIARAVRADCILDPRAVSSAVSSLGLEDFVSSAHRRRVDTLDDAISARHRRRASPVPPAMLVCECGDRPTSESDGRRGVDPRCPRGPHGAFGTGRVRLTGLRGGGSHPQGAAPRGAPDARKPPHVVLPLPQTPERRSHRSSASPRTAVGAAGAPPVTSAASHARRRRTRVTTTPRPPPVTPSPRW